MKADVFRLEKPAESADGTGRASRSPARREPIKSHQFIHLHQKRQPLLPSVNFAITFTKPLRGEHAADGMTQEGNTIDDEKHSCECE
jgi:hypothetical protein